MKRKKKFISPQVLKQVDVCLEKDLLVGPSVQYQMTVRSMGQELVEMNFDPENEDGYTVEWD